LEKIPDDRYASARDLMNDLDRWLGGETVSARRSSRITRARKWCLRNPGFTAAFALVSAVLVFASVQWRQAVVANERGDRHFAMAQEIIVEMAIKVTSNPDLPAEMRQSFSQRAVDLQLQLLLEEPDDPNVVLQTAKAYDRLFVILYDVSEFEDALAAVTEALEIVEPFCDYAKIADAKQQFIRRKSAVLRALQRYEEASENIDNEIQIETLSDLNLARTFYQRGMGNIAGRKDPEAASADFQKAYAIFSGLENPEHLKHEIARNLFFYGTAEMFLGNLEDADQLFEEALELFEAMHESSHSNETAIEDMGRCNMSMARVSLAQLKEDGLAAITKSALHAESRSQFEKAEELFREVFEINPGRNGAYGMLAMTFEIHIRLEIEQRDAARAKSVLKQFDALYPIVPRDMRERQTIGRIIAQTHLNLAKLQIELGETDKAIEQLVQANEFLDRLLIEFPGVEALEDLQAQCRSLLSEISEISETERN